MPNEEDIKYFMGMVDQSLKAGNKLMDDLSNKVEQLNQSVVSLNGKILVTKTETDMRREECNKKFKHTEDCLGRDKRDLDRIKKVIDTDDASTAKSRKTVTFVVSITLLVIALINVWFFIKSKSNDVIIKLDKETITKILEKKDNK